MEYIFNKKYYKEDVNTTFRYPFYVDEETEKLEVYIQIIQSKKSSHYKDPRPDFIAVGLEHNGVIRAWNCCHKDYLLVAEEYGLPGSIPGKIEKGQWHLIIFPRTKNEISEVGVHAKVVTTQKQYRFVKGDTHLHTYHSDGSISVDRLFEKAKEIGLDYVCVTDHNISSANYSLPKDKGVLPIPGVEYGIEAGHMNIIGETTSVKDFSWDPNFLCYERVLSNLKNTSAGIGMNHPFCTDSPWKLSLDMDFDWVEVWNGMWRPVNDRAVRWWHDELCKGRKLPIIGGSDAHNDNDYFIKHGFPTTHAYVNELKSNKVVSAFKNGHVYITMMPTGVPKFWMHSDNNIMGETTKDRRVTIRIEELEPMDNIMIYTDKGEKSYEVIESTFDLDFNPVDEKFVRVQIRRKINAKQFMEGLDFHTWVTVLLSNPMYFI